MSVFDVKCQICHKDCRVLGHKFKLFDVPVFTAEIAMKVARYCWICNKVICGECGGISLSTLGSVSVACPYCGGNLSFATPEDVKKSGAR